MSSIEHFDSHSVERFPKRSIFKRGERDLCEVGDEGIGLDCLSLSQTRHPERSASQIVLGTAALWRVVEGPRRYVLADAVQDFPIPLLKARGKRVEPFLSSGHQDEIVTTPREAIHVDFADTRTSRR